MVSARTVVKVGLSLGLTAFFLWSAFRTVDLHSVWRILLDTDAIWLFGSVALIILATYPRAFRWRILMAPVVTGISTGKLFMAILIGYAGNNLIPRAGEIAKVWAVDREPARMSGLIATVAVERLIDLLTLLVMFAAATYVIRGRLEQVFPWMEGMATTATVFIVLATIILFVISMFGQPFLEWLGRKYQKIEKSRIVELAGSFLKGTASKLIDGLKAKKSVNNGNSKPEYDLDRDIFAIKNHDENIELYIKNFQCDCKEFVILPSGVKHCKHLLKRIQQK